MARRPSGCRATRVSGPPPLPGRAAGERVVPLGQVFQVLAQRGGLGDEVVPRLEHAGLSVVSGVSRMAGVEPGDAERRPRVTRLLGAAEDNRGAKTAGPVKRRLQALLMRLFVPLFHERATAWLYGCEPARLPG